MNLTALTAACALKPHSSLMTELHNDFTLAPSLSKVVRRLCCLRSDAIAT
jgi:hypothetical protein